MADLPTTPPWEYDTPTRLNTLPRDRIVIVANSSVSWSYSECVYYANLRGIPVGNIFQVAMGTNGADQYPATWNVTNSTEADTLLMTPLKTLCESIGAVAILLGPGTAPTVLWNDNVGVMNMAVPLAGLVATVPAWKEGYSETDVYAYSSGGYVTQSRLVGGISYGQGKNSTFFTPDVNDIAPGFADSWDLPPSTGFSPDIYIPTAEAIQRYASGVPISRTVTTNPYRYQAYPQIPVGRIGFASYGGGYAGPPPVAETQPRVRAIIDSITTAMRDHTHAGALAKPMIFHLSPNDGGINSRDCWAYLYSLARSWGINASFAYYDVASSYSETYAPIAQSRYTDATILAGTVPNIPYYMIVGEWKNPATAGLGGAYYSTPYSTQWSPMAGAGMMQGPSLAFELSNNCITQGGGCVLTDHTHITTGNEHTYMSTWYNLLRGMSWLEAAGCGSQWWGSVPNGDPLWAPYKITPYYTPGDASRGKLRATTRLQPLPAKSFRR